MSPEKSVVDIKTHILWYKCIMRPATQRYVRHIVGPKAFGEREYSSEEKAANQKEIWEMILPKMEEFLSDKQRDFMCSHESLTIIDIQYYNELNQILFLDYSQNISQDNFPELTKWMIRVKECFDKKSKSKGSPEMANSLSQGSVIEKMDRSYKEIID